MESMTDCAFSCPISDDESNKGSALFLDIPCRGGERRWQRMVFVFGFVPFRGGKDGEKVFFYFDSNQGHFARDYDHCCGLCARSWSHA